MGFYLLGDFMLIWSMRNIKMHFWRKYSWNGFLILLPASTCIYSYVKADHPWIMAKQKWLWCHMGIQSKVQCRWLDQSVQGLIGGHRIYPKTIETFALVDRPWGSGSGSGKGVASSPDGREECVPARWHFSFFLKYKCNSFHLELLNTTDGFDVFWFLAWYFRNYYI